MTDKLTITSKTQFAQFDAFVSQKGKAGGVQGAMGKGGLEIYTSKKAAAKLNSKAVGQNMKLCTVSSLGQELGKKGLHAAILNTYGPEVADYVFTVMKQDLFAPGARIDSAMMAKVRTTITNMFQHGPQKQSDLHRNQSAILAQIKQEARESKAAKEAKKPSVEASRPPSVSVRAADDGSASADPQTIGRQRAILFLESRHDGFMNIPTIDNLLFEAGLDDEKIDRRAATAAVIDAFEQDAVANHGRTDNSEARNTEIAVGALKQYLAGVRMQQPAAHAQHANRPSAVPSEPRPAAVDLAGDVDQTQSWKSAGHDTAIEFLDSRHDGFVDIPTIDNLLLEAGLEDEDVDKREAKLAVIDAFEQDAVANHGRSDNSDAHNTEIAVQALKRFLSLVQEQPPAAPAPEADKSGAAGQPHTAAARPTDHRFGNEHGQTLAKQRALLLLDSRVDGSKDRTGLHDLLDEAGWQHNRIDRRKATLAVLNAFVADPVLTDRQAKDYDAHARKVAVGALRQFLATVPNQPAPQAAPPPKPVHQDAQANNVEDANPPHIVEEDENVDDDDDDYADNDSVLGAGDRSTIGLDLSEDDLDDVDEEDEEEIDEDALNVKDEPVKASGLAEVAAAASGNAAAVHDVQGRLTEVRGKVDALNKTYRDLESLVTNNQRQIAARRKALAGRRRAGSLDTHQADKARRAREVEQARNAKRTNGFSFAEAADNGGNGRGVPPLGDMLKAAGLQKGQRYSSDDAKKAIIEGFANYDENDYPTLTRAQHATKIAIPALRAYLQNVNK